MNFIYLAIVAIIAFGSLGFWRGWLREVATIAGLLVAWLFVVGAGGLAVGLVNRIYLMVAFTIRGGFDSSAPGNLLQTLRSNPLIEPARPGGFYAVLFAALAIASYLLANRFAPAVSQTSARLLGVLVGLANGYLLAYLALRYVAPAIPISIAEPSPANPVDVLGRYLPTVLLIGVILAIGIALLSSRRFSGRGGGRMAPGRAKG